MRWNRFGVAGLAVALAACGETTGPELDDQLLSAEEVAVMAADGAFADLAQLDASLPSGLVASSADGATTVTRSRSRTFYDADGAEMDGFDELLTARIVTTSEVTREASRGPWSASMSESRTMEISGLAGEETQRTFDGSGSSEKSRARVGGDQGDRTFDSSSSSEIRSVVRAVDRVAQPWPLSGSIARDIEVTRTGGPNGDVTRTRSTLLTFNGTQYATLTVDGETFEVDLAARGNSSGVSKPGSRP